MTEGLAKILELKPVEYSWKHKPGSKELGFLAQQLQKCSTGEYLVDSKPDADGYYNVNTTAIIPILVKAVQELSKLHPEKAAEISKFEIELLQFEKKLEDHKIVRFIYLIINIYRRRKRL